MNKEDLKVGQVVEIKSDDKDLNGLCIVTEGASGIRISGSNYYCTLDWLNNDLISIGGDTKITKVYSRALIRDAYKVSTEGRELLWERKEMEDKIDIEKMTIGQLMELGYEVDVTFKPKYK